MEREQLTMAQFEARLQAQGVPPEHCAFKCARCGHIQSAASLVKYMAAERNGVRTAYLVIVLPPGGRCIHAELGMADALGKPVIIFSASTDPFDKYEGATCAFYWNENVHQVHSCRGKPEKVLPSLIRYGYMEAVPC